MNSHAELERAIGALQRRDRSIRFGENLQRTLLVVLFGVGAIALVARFAHAGSETFWLSLLGAAVFVVAPLFALWRSSETRLSNEEATTALDLAGGGSGSLVTAIETGTDPRWEERVQKALAVVPNLNSAPWLPRFQALLPGLAFALLACLIPMPAQDQPGPPQEFFTKREEALREKLSALEETLELREETESQLEKQLERLEAEARDGSPESFFEAADTLEEDIEAAANEAAEEIERARETLSDAAEAAREADSQSANSSDANAKSPEDSALASQLALEASLENLASDLAGQELEAPDGEWSEAAKELAKKLAEELSQEQRDALAEAMKKQGEGAKLSPEDLAKLSEALRKGLGDKLAKLAQKGLLKPGKFDPNAKLARANLSEFKMKEGSKPCSSSECKSAGQCEGGKDCDGKSHCHNPDCMSAGSCQGGGQCLGGSMASGLPGQGGISRGRADAEMTWGEETEDAAEFEPDALPPGQIPDVDSSVLLGVSSTSPTAQPQSESATGGPAGQASAGEAAWKRRLSPSHRDAVKRFFASDGE